MHTRERSMLPPYYVYGILGVLLENTSGHGVSHLPTT